MSDRTIAREYITPLKYGKDSEKQVGPQQTAKYLAHAEGFIAGLMTASHNNNNGHITVR